MPSLPVLPTRAQKYNADSPKLVLRRSTPLCIVGLLVAALYSRSHFPRAGSGSLSEIGDAASGPILGVTRSFIVKNETACSGSQILSRSFSKRIIVSERSRLMYCPIPKAASSNWKYLIRKFEGLDDYFELSKAHSPETSGLRYLSDYSPREVESLLRDPSYFKFTFTRDPYARIMSCFMDKFQNRDESYVRAEYRLFLAQLFDWRYANDVDIDTAPRPSFAQFVDELSKQNPMAMNEHWMPQALLCGFGEMPYDFVGRMENLADDAKYVLSTIGHGDEEFPSQAQIGFPSSGGSTSTVDDIQTLETMMKLRVLYDVDFNSKLGAKAG